MLERGEGCAIVAGFASDDIAEKTSLRVGEVVVAADGRRLAGAAWDDIVARIGCCGRAGVPLELVVRKPNRGLDVGLDAIELQVQDQDSGAEAQDDDDSSDAED